MAKGGKQERSRTLLPLLPHLPWPLSFTDVHPTAPLPKPLVLLYVCSRNQSLVVPWGWGFTGTKSFANNLLLDNKTPTDVIYYNLHLRPWLKLERKGWLCPPEDAKQEN